MDLKQEIEQFEKTFNELTQYENQIVKKAVDKFNAVFQELSPLITFMKSKGIYFTHPELQHSRTTEGVIIGRNLKDNRIIYVYDGVGRLVKQVDTREDETVPVEGRNLTLHKFLENCDLEFAIKGIEYTRNALPRISAIFRETLDKKNEIIESL